MKVLNILFFLTTLIQDDDYQRLKDIIAEQESESSLAKITTILSIALITILSFLTLALYKNNNIRLRSNNMLHEKNEDLIEAIKKAERETIETKKRLKKYTFIRIDKHLRTAISQYLSFFSTYIEESKKVKISLHLEESEDGINITFDIPDDLERETIQTWFNEYLEHLYDDRNQITINTTEGVSVEQLDILILKLKEQINHYQRQIDILKIENTYLKDNIDYFKDVIKLLSSKSTQMFISTSKNEIKKQNNYSNQSQFIGSTFNEGQFNISNIDDKLIEIINESVLSNIEKKELIKSVEIIKQDSVSEKEKKKSGGLIRKFLETTASESAKEVLKYVIENGESWLKYISNL